MSSGPLSAICIGTDLSCQVRHVSDPNFLEFYPAWQSFGDCGTLLAVGNTLYSPNFNNHPLTATGALGPYTTFTPISQSAVTGSGTSADPYSIVTVVDAGSSGLRITETDSYVVGQESYRTDIQVANTSSQSVPVRLYRAGDCYLGQDDFGYGLVNPGTGLVACTKNPNNLPAGRLMEWDPVTPPDHYQQDIYYNIWSQIGTKGDLTDTCRGLSGTCPATSPWDNAAALQWNLPIGPGSSQTISHYTTFSPGGSQPLHVQKTADTYLVAPGAPDGYTVAVSNPNGFNVSLNSITDTLPSGFSYVSGSSTGVTTANPAGSSTLVWNGPYSVPATGSISLHFNVTTSTTPGVYCNSATADAGATSVIPAQNTACISTGPTPTPVVTFPPGPTPTPCVVGGQACTPAPAQTPGPTPTGKAPCPAGTPIPGCGTVAPVSSGPTTPPALNAVGGIVELTTSAPGGQSGSSLLLWLALATGMIGAASSSFMLVRRRPAEER